VGNKIVLSTESAKCPVKGAGRCNFRFSFFVFRFSFSRKEKSLLLRRRFVLADFINSFIDED